MKTRYALLSLALAIGMTLTLFGETTHHDSTRAGMKKQMWKVMGKPEINETVEGLSIKVWLMTQKQHKKMMKGKMGEMMMHGEKDEPMEKMEMKGMNDSSMEMGHGMKHDRMQMNKATMDSMMAGTHHIVVDVSDDASGEEIGGARANIHIVSPSEKKTSVDLKAMMSHFGGALTLDEKGKYKIIVTIDAGGVTRTAQFQYRVK